MAEARLAADILSQEDRCESLSKENAELRQKLARLLQQIDFLTNHKTLVAGFSGETLVSKIVDGIATAYATSFDVIDRSGRRIEVKYARLNNSVRGYTSKRWAWGKIFGEGGSKDFDYLVLVGEQDERYGHLYKDRAVPYVFFAVPFAETTGLTMPMGRYRAIQLTSNPAKAQRSKAARLFTKYQVTSTELATMFGL